MHHQQARHYPIPWSWNGHTFDVYPTVYRRILNYGLNRQHAHRRIFPTEESIEQRIINPGWKFDELGNLAGGMQLSRMAVIRLTAGTTLYRFGDTGGHEGGWWTSRDGMFRMLLKVEPRRAGLPGVVDGQELTLRDYARKYSEVLTEWGNGMRYMFCTRLRGPVMAFRGMGASQQAKVYQLEIPGSGGQTAGTIVEKMNDDNRQIFIPNVFGRIDAPPQGEPSFFSPVRKWLPEVLEQRLTPAILERLQAGDTYRYIVPDMENWLMSGNKRTPFPTQPKAPHIQR